MAQARTGFLIDASRCIGCRACQVACKEWNRLDADPTTQQWWAVCKPCQKPLASRAPEEWWAGMEEVFHSV